MKNNRLQERLPFIILILRIVSADVQLVPDFRILDLTAGVLLFATYGWVLYSTDFYD